MGNSINGAEKNLIKMRGFVSFIVYANTISHFFFVQFGIEFKEFRLAKEKRDNCVI